MAKNMVKECDKSKESLNQIKAAINYRPRSVHTSFPKMVNHMYEDEMNQNIRFLIGLGNVKSKISHIWRGQQSQGQGGSIIHEGTIKIDDDEEILQIDEDNEDSEREDLDDDELLYNPRLIGGKSVIVNENTDTPVYNEA